MPQAVMEAWMSWAVAGLLLAMVPLTVGLVAAVVALASLSPPVVTMVGERPLLIQRAGVVMAAAAITAALAVMGGMVGAAMAAAVTAVLG